MMHGIKLCSSEFCPEGYVVLKKDGQAIWVGRIPNAPEDLEFDEIISNPKDFHCLKDAAEETAQNTGGKLVRAQ